MDFLCVTHIPRHLCHTFITAQSHRLSWKKQGNDKQKIKTLWNMFVMIHDTYLDCNKGSVKRKSSDFLFILLDVEL